MTGVLHSQSLEIYILVKKEISKPVPFQGQDASAVSIQNLSVAMTLTHSSTVFSVNCWPSQTQCTVPLSSYMRPHRSHRSLHSSHPPIWITSYLHNCRDYILLSLHVIPKPYHQGLRFIEREAWDRLQLLPMSAPKLSLLELILPQHPTPSTHLGPDTGPVTLPVGFLEGIMCKIHARNLTYFWYQVFRKGPHCINGDLGTLNFLNRENLWTMRKAA